MQCKLTATRRHGATVRGRLLRERYRLLEAIIVRWQRSRDRRDGRHLDGTGHCAPAARRVQGSRVL